MKRSILLLVTSCLSSLVCPLSGFAQQFQQDGVTYRQTTRTERRPVATTHWDEKATTVYREQYVTQMQDAYRTVYSPVTEYYMQPRWHNWWNPFAPPHVAYHMKPRMRWESRVERYQTPVTFREVVPETRIVRTPTRTLGFQEHQVVDRVAVTPQRTETRKVPTRTTQSSATTVAIPQASNAVGGIRRIDNDPPRHGPQIRGGTFRR